MLIVTQGYLVLTLFQCGSKDYEMESCVRGFHVYNELWTLHVGDNLQCIPDSGNRDDPFAVAVKHGIDTVGHVSQKVSCICSLFLRHGGSISCTVTG